MSGDSRQVGSRACLQNSVSHTVVSQDHLTQAEAWRGMPADYISHHKSTNEICSRVHRAKLELINWKEN